MKKIIKLIKQPSLAVIYLMNKGFFNWLNDEAYLKIKYRLIMKKKLNLKNPKTFNEKLQWLKLYDRKDIYTTMVDKYEAKKYVSKIIGEEYIIPTLGIYNSFEEINFNKLPNQFVIKPTHTSGDVYICEDKNKIDYKRLKKEVNCWLKRKYYYLHREWPYKNVKPRIIIENYLKDEKNRNIIDYKFFCFSGEPKLMYVSKFSHNENAQIAFFDMNYKQIHIKRLDYKDLIDIPQKPIKFEEMKELSKKLSKNLKHIRVDFYEINEKIYFGEMTFYTGAGYIPFENEKYDEILGNMIKL